MEKLGKWGMERKPYNLNESASHEQQRITGVLFAINNAIKQTMKDFNVLATLDMLVMYRILLID